MKNFPIQTRREFLRSTIVGGSLAATLPGFVLSTMNQVHADTVDQANPSEQPIVVLLQMAGGNDGLNTVVPVENDHYFKARKELHIPKNKTLRVQDDLGFHPSLTGLKSLYDEGYLSVVQGVGYPNPNRSHFRSTEIWHTASSANEFESKGWVGRYFDNQCSGCDPAVGIAMDKTMPQAFWAETPKGIALQNPSRIEKNKNNKNNKKKNNAEEEFFSQLNSLGELDHASITSSGSSLEFIQRVSLDAEISMDQIRKTLVDFQPKQKYPNNRLAQELKTVAQLIGGGMPARIYFVSQGGYDTHANQTANHARLLKDYSDSLESFILDLKHQGNLDKVIVMTFSEFGRRVEENASGGTDHGAAAPVFLAGGAIKPGVYGKHPNLDPAKLDRGDLKYSVDFRSIYAELLEDVLHTSSESVLQQKFPTIGLIDKA